MLAAAPLSRACLIGRCSVSAGVKAVMAASKSKVQEGPQGDHSRAPYHRIGLLSMVAQPGDDPGSWPYESHFLASEAALQMAAGTRIERVIPLPELIESASLR